MPDLSHTCHWPGCLKPVQPSKWGCATHWFALPMNLRFRLMANYRPGQEVDKNPTAAYLEAASAIQTWIRENIDE